MLFFADPAVPGLAMRLEREALRRLKAEGLVNDVIFFARNRGTGERIGAVFRRLGAEKYGDTYQLWLKPDAGACALGQEG